MTPTDITKRERQTLRELAGDVYEAELGLVLADLARDFDRWRAGELFASELSQAIHEFHQGESRRLWSMYQTLPEADIVARGLARGFIADSKVLAPLREKLRSLVAVYGK